MKSLLQTVRGSVLLLCVAAATGWSQQVGAPQPRQKLEDIGRPMAKGGPGSRTPQVQARAAASLPVVISSSFRRGW